METSPSSLRLQGSRGETRWKEITGRRRAERGEGDATFNLPRLYVSTSRPDISPAGQTAERGNHDNHRPRTLRPLNFVFSRLMTEERDGNVFYAEHLLCASH